MPPPPPCQQAKRLDGRYAQADVLPRITTSTTSARSLQWAPPPLHHHPHPHPHLCTAIIILSPNYAAKLPTTAPAERNYPGDGLGSSPSGPALGLINTAAAQVNARGRRLPWKNLPGRAQRRPSVAAPRHRQMLSGTITTRIPSSESQPRGEIDRPPEFFFRPTRALKSALRSTLEEVNSRASRKSEDFIGRCPGSDEGVRSGG